MSFNVGDLVQLEDDYVIKDGEVIQVDPPLMTRPDDYYRLPDEEMAKCHPQLTIKWEDGSQSVESEMYLVTQDDEFQREFRLANNKASELIAKHLSDAEEALSKAVDVSEEYGVPFSSGISFLSQNFHPSTTSEKFPEVDSEFINELKWN